MTTPAPNLTGNWAFTTQPSASTTTQLTLNAGLSTLSNGQVTAVGHLNGASCASAQTAIHLAGSLNEFGELKLISEPFSGTTLTIKGEILPGSTTVTNTTMTFAGGTCGSLGAQAATSTQYSQINGTYSGNFVDQDGTSFGITATLVQTTQPDANGTFHLQGTPTFQSNPCFTQPVITDSLVTGDNLSTTYVQGNATIAAVGTFNADATQLTVTNWQVSGGMCDGSHGTGLLIEQ
ncbi:MAG: hypothetical protein ACLGSD_03000 [Acidobacteriota bacterium]